MLCADKGLSRTVLRLSKSRVCGSDELGAWLMAESTYNATGLESLA